MTALNSDVLKHVFDQLDDFPHMAGSTGKRSLCSAVQVSHTWKAIAEPVLFRHIVLWNRRDEWLVTRLQQEPEHVIGSWIRTLEWRANRMFFASNTAETVRSTLEYVLSQTVNLHRLFLELKFPHNKNFFSFLRVIPLSLREFHLDTQSTSLEPLEMISQFEQLERLCIYTCLAPMGNGKDVSWPAVPWTLPKLRSFYFWGDIGATSFLSRCIFPRLTDLELEFREPTEYDPIRREETATFLKKHTLIDRLKLVMPVEHLPLLLPLMSMRILDLRSSKLSADLISRLAPTVRQLKMTVGISRDEETKSVMDALLQKQLDIQEIHLFTSSRMEPVGQFSWARKPQWLITQEDLGLADTNDEEWQAGMEFLKFCSREFHEHGIRLCDSYGRTVEEAAASGVKKSLQPSH